MIAVRVVGWLGGIRHRRRGPTVSPEGSKTVLHPHQEPPSLGSSDSTVRDHASTVPRVLLGSNEAVAGQSGGCNASSGLVVGSGACGLLVVWQSSRAAGTGAVHNGTPGMGMFLGVEVPWRRRWCLTPSRWQLRRREVPWGGSRRRDLGPDGQEPRSRRGDLGEPAMDGEARHHRQGASRKRGRARGTERVLIRGGLPGCRQQRRRPSRRRGGALGRSQQRP